MIKCRFSPSPTGSMHIGNLRNALYSYAWAKKNNGKFVLRIEDTDKSRCEDKYIREIKSLLDIFKLKYDEYYIQSERLEIYKKYLKILIDKNLVYKCICNNNETCNCKENQNEIKSNFCYKLNISLYNSNIIQCYDSIRKTNINFNKNELYDIVLIKSDGFPTYHFASVIDDYLMEITDIFRSDEWIASFPYHKILYDYLDFNMPKFYHLPLITNINGKKLSKRDGDFSVMSMLNVLYLPIGIINYLGTLGYCTNIKHDFFNLNTFIDIFNINKLKLCSICYDEKKINKLNLKHIRTKEGTDELVEILKIKYNKNDLDKIKINRLIKTIKLSGISYIQFYDKYLENLYNYKHKLNHYLYINKLSNNNKRLSLFITNLILFNLGLLEKTDNLKYFTKKGIEYLLDYFYRLGFTKKEINEYFRFILVGDTVGYPIEIILELVSVDDLLEIKEKLLFL